MAESTESLSINPAASSPQSTDETTLYTSISAYPFSSDPDFQNGLSSILGHPETPPTPEEIASNHDLVLQAQCFYYARKFSTAPIDPGAYKVFLASTTTSNNFTDPTPAPVPGPTQTQPAPQPVSNGTTATPSTSAHQSEAQPPYPPTFAEIVDLITSNKPIPGIETIPETVLEPGSSKIDHTSRRRKPWETNAETPVDGDIFGNGGDVRAVGWGAGEGGGQGEGVGARKSEGVMKILQPDAIPDSGLIAKD